MRRFLVDYWRSILVICSVLLIGCNPVHTIGEIAKLCFLITFACLNVMIDFELAKEKSVQEDLNETVKILKGNKK